MILFRQRIINYLFGLVLLSIFVLNIPITQPLKYFIFIIFNFFFIVSTYKKVNFFNKKFIISFICFILILIIIKIIPISFNFEINSFGNINLDEIDNKASNFYKENYSECLKDKICFGENNYNFKFKNQFNRQYLNVKNINELRTNIFTSPGTTMNNSIYVQPDTYPYIIDLTFPKLFNGSKFCYDDFETRSNCFVISESKNNFSIIGKGENNNIKLTQSTLLIFIKVLLSIIFFISFYTMILNFYKFKIRNSFELFYPISFIFWLAIFSFTNNNNINLLNSYFFQYPGGDGYWYLFLGNLISENLKQFNIVEALRGGKDIFYFMPGMRYFVGIEKLLFGNAYYLHLAVFSFLPFVLKKLLELYLSKKITKILMISFLFIPLMHHMGFSFFQYIRYASKVFAEPIAYTIFIYGFTRLVLFYKDKKFYIKSLPFTCLLLCISCILRPNLSSSSFFLLLLPLFYLILQKKIKILIYFLLCGTVIFLPLFHNYFFGNELILFTSAVFTDANIKITLTDYYNFLTNFNISNEKKIMIIEIIKNFFNPFEIHKYFIILGVIYSLHYKNLKDNLILPIHILIFSQFYLFLFLNPGPRYIWIFWLASLILSLNMFLNLKFKRKRK